MSGVAWSTLAWANLSWLGRATPRWSRAPRRACVRPRRSRPRRCLPPQESQQLAQVSTSWIYGPVLAGPSRGARRRLGRRERPPRAQVLSRG